MNKTSIFFGRLPVLLVLICLVLLVGIRGWAQPQIENQPIPAGKDDSQVSQVKEKITKDWHIEFSEDFSDVEIGQEPESLFILDGDYTVQKGEKDRKSLKLPGTPMGDFGLLFGPREKEKNLELNFSFFASNKGRRMPSIAASIGGIRGYCLRLSPAAKKIVLSMDETILQESMFSWKGDQWWKIRFQALTGSLIQSTRLQFKLWPEKEKEPADWYLSEVYDVEYIGGKCALWGFPYSSMPILFDDLEIRSN